MPPATSRSTPDPGRATRLSRPQQVAEAIKQWVMAEAWQPGDRLPSEAELITRFGMAKGTIREAVRILEAQGLVRSRTGPGGGVFVHRVSAERTAALLGNYFYFEHLSIDDVYQVREQLEPELAASLTGKLTDAQIAGLEAVMATYAEPARTAEEERAQHVESLRFHAVLADMSGNPLLRFLIRFIATMLSQITVRRRLYEPMNRELWSSGMTYQARLLEALKGDDPERTRAILREHMLNAHKLMRLQEAAVTRQFLPESRLF